MNHHIISLAPSLPPRYINLPVGIAYNPNLSSGALRTFLRIYGLYWDRSNPPRLKLLEWYIVTGVKRTAFFSHLKELESSGWLLSRSDDEGVFSFKFPKTLTENPDDRSENRTRAPLLNNNLDLSQGITKRVEVVRDSGKTAKKKSDPLLKDPGVVAYRAVHHLWPNHEQRRLIAAAVKDLERWRAALAHWAAHGWSPKNVQGMLDSYNKGGASACPQCQREGCSPDPVQKVGSLEALRARIDAARITATRQAEKEKQARCKPSKR